MTVLFADLVGDMYSESGGCPEPTLERQLRDISIDFLTHSELWQDRRIIQTVTGQDDYFLPTGPDQAILKLTYCSVDGKELLQSVPHRDFPQHGAPHWYFLRDDTLYLRPYERLKGSIEVEMVLTTTRESIGIPSKVANTYGPGLQAGALARVLMMASTPWYNPKAAADYSAMYHAAKMSARREGTRANHSRIRKTRFSW